MIAQARKNLKHAPYTGEHGRHIYIGADFLPKGMGPAGSSNDIGRLDFGALRQHGFHAVAKTVEVTIGNFHPRRGGRKSLFAGFVQNIVDMLNHMNYSFLLI